MSQTDTMAVSPNTISREELLALKKRMNAKALTRRRLRTGGLLAGNVVMAFVILLPLLYAVSIAFMPSGELFTTDLNILPQHPTLQNFADAFTNVPKCPAAEIYSELIYYGGMYHSRTDHYMFAGGVRIFVP